jgi:hypothetical protein
MKTAWTGLAFIQKRTPFFCFTVPEVWASNGKKSHSVCQLAGLTAPSAAEDHGSCAPADPVSAGLQSSIAKGNHSHAGAAAAWRIGASSNPLSNVVSRKRKKSYCVWAAAGAMTTYPTSPRECTGGPMSASALLMTLLKAALSGRYCVLPALPCSQCLSGSSASF